MDKDTSRELLGEFGKNSRAWLEDITPHMDSYMKGPALRSQSIRNPEGIARGGQIFNHLDNLRAGYTAGLYPHRHLVWWVHLPFHKPGNYERMTPIRCGSQRGRMQSKMFLGIPGCHEFSISLHLEDRRVPAAIGLSSAGPGGSCQAAHKSSTINPSLASL